MPSRPTRRLLLNTKAFLWLAALGLLLRAGAPGTRAVYAAPTRDAESVPISALVSADDELAGYLRQARDHIEAERYDQAIDIVQALIARRDSGFMPSGDSARHYTSLWQAAQELIRSMPEAGRKLYRALYDPQARQLLDQARGASDVSLLRRVATEYRYTSLGPAALEALGGVHFDLGEFTLAAEAWAEAMDADSNSPRRPELLARIAAARRLAGDEDEWRRILRRLESDFPRAEAVFAGERRNVARFVASLEALEPADLLDRPEGVWAGAAIAPDGMIVMDPSDAVLVPRWRRPEDSATSGPDLPDGLIALKNVLRVSNNPHMSMVVRLQAGHVRAELKYGSRAGRIVCPATVHPVVVGEQVLLRTDQGVEAYDAFTGAREWMPRDPMPLYRNLPELNSTRYYREYSFFGNRIGDKGRHALAVADGRVFALGEFLPPLHPTVQANLRRRSVERSLRRKLSDTSTLAAYALENGTLGRAGQRLWSVGYADEDGPLADCKFLSAPTPHAGRLYAVAVRLQNLQLVCLDARDGSLLWRSSISQLPALDRRFAVLADYAFERGSSPAVAGGRVYVATNAGVVAAFDAATGRAVWAHQYDRLGEVRRPFNPNSPVQELFYPPNPLLVSRGRVVCLPADSEDVLAFSAEDGLELWRADRNDLRDLTAIDGDRLLLSGPGLAVLSFEDGRVLFEEQAGLNIHGRPAVTPEEALASDDGRLLRLSLSDYRTAAAGLGDARGLLGNLVSFGGKLVAANAAGVCTYFNYEQARGRVSRMIEAAGSARRAELLFQRGQLAFNAGRFEQARDDLSECYQQALARGDTRIAPSARIWLYRTHVALGNLAESPDQMRSEFGRAMDLAETDQERAHMLLRFARYRESIGEYERAARLAQDISDRYAEEPLVDVRIGPQAADETRFGDERATVQGRRLAQDYIRRLVELYGRELYADIDRQAREAFRRALATEDPERMIAVARRWPNSLAADEALVTAAEIYYTRALPAHYEARRLAKAEVRDRARAFAGQADQLFGRSVELLSEVANRRSSRLRLDAGVAIAIVYARRGYDTTASLRCREVRRLCRQDPSCNLDRPIAFGEVRAPIEEVIRSIETGRLEPPTEGAGFGSVLRPPLSKAWSLEDATAQFLRDHEYQPIRLGENLLLVRGATVSLVDISAPDLDGATRWSVELPIEPKLIEKFASYPPGQRLMGGLSRDQKTLIISDRQSVSAVRAVSGEVIWQKRDSRLFDRPIDAMAMADDLWIAADIGGKLVCLDVQTGEELWRTATVGKPERLVGSPRVAHGLVMVSNTNFRHIQCFSARTGKLVARFSADTYAQGLLSDEGFVVLMIDGELTVREAARVGGPPLWSRKYSLHGAEDGRPQAVFPTVLDVTGDRVVVLPDQTSSQIEILSMTESGREVAALSTSASAREQALPVEAWTQGDRLYVACSSATAGRPKAGFGRYSTSRGFSLLRFDLAGRADEPRWRTVLESDPRSYGQVLPPTLTEGHLVALVKHYQVQLPFYASVLGAEDGEVVKRIDLEGLPGDPKTRLMRRRSIGPPIVTNGRLCVETCDGIEIYEGQ